MKVIHVAVNITREDNPCGLGGMFSIHLYNYHTLYLRNKQPIKARVYWQVTLCG